MEGQQNQHIRSPIWSYFLPQQEKPRNDFITCCLDYLITTYYRLGSGWPEGRAESLTISQTKVLILRWYGQWMNRKMSGVRIASAQTLGRSVEQGMLPGLFGKRPDKTFQKGPLFLGFILSWIYTDKETPFILNRF